MFDKKKVARKVMDDLIVTMSTIRNMQTKLDKLNGSVQRGKDKYYDTQINSMEYGNESRKVINDIRILASCIENQDIKLREIISDTTHGISSKRITTRISWASKDGEYNHGQLVLYRGGIGNIPTWGCNTVRITNTHDLMNVLNTYGDRLTEFVPTKAKREILEIIVKYAKMDYKKVGELKYPNHKYSNKLHVLETDLSDNYSFRTDDVSSVTVTNSRFSPTIFYIELNSPDSYSSNKIYLNRTINNEQLYKIATNWEPIRNDMIKIKNLLTKIYNSHAHIIKNITTELSPYLLAKKI